MSGSPIRLVALTLLTTLLPSVALAQAPRAGVVTTLEGNVTARRIALPDPVALKFKDDVFLQDTVTTGDKALARMLLGGKALVTVRERSVLTITEVPGKSTLELETGKFALAVAREKMRPGEEIQIRTPNAVAGVRGTVVSSGNTINITNTLCSGVCSTAGGISFLATNGATVSISGSAIKNGTLGSIVLSDVSGRTAAIVADGTNTKVVISGQ